MCPGERRVGEGMWWNPRRETVQDQWPQELISDARADRLTDPAQGSGMAHRETGAIGARQNNPGSQMRWRQLPPFSRTKATDPE